jgi:hypothetical protein
MTDVQDAELYDRVGRASFGDNFGENKYAFYWHLGADGVTLDAKKSYSVIPIILTLYNYPPEYRTKPGYTFLVGLVPGGCSNLDVFLAPLLEELKKTFEDGFQVFDVMTGKWHLAHNILLCSVFDLRGLPKFTCNSQHPSRLGCHVCKLYGSYVKNQTETGGTMVYEGSFAFLPEDDPLRAFLFETRIPDPKKKIPPYFRRSAENDLPPAKKTHAEVLEFGAESDLVPARRYKNGQLKTPFVCKYLPGFNVVDAVHADIMHQNENFGKCIAKTMLGHNQCTWVRVRPVEARRGKWPAAETEVDTAPYVLSKLEIEKFNREVSEIRLPRTHGSSLRPFLNPSVYIHLKAHDWKVVLGDILIYLVRDIDPIYRKLWVDLCQIFKTVNSYSITEDVIASLRQDIVAWMVQSEFLLPTSQATIVRHYLLHIPDTLALLGPAFTTWMFGNETLNGILTAFSHSSHHHERSIMKKWILFKCAFFCGRHLPGLFDDEGPLVVEHLPSTWTCARTVDGLCDQTELNAFCNLLGEDAGPNNFAVTKRIFSGKKVFKAIPSLDDAFYWTMGKCTVQIRSDKYFDERFSVNGFSYATIHTIYIYVHTNVKYVFFRCCMWKAKYDDVSSLVKVQQPSFEEFVYINATDVTTNVCLFLPRNNSRLATYNHLVAVISPDARELSK